MIQVVLDWFKEPLDTPRWFPVMLLAIMYLADWLNKRDQG